VVWEIANWRDPVEPIAFVERIGVAADFFAHCVLEQPVDENDVSPGHGITLPVPDAPRIVLTRALLERPDGTTRLGAAGR
jgi:hypothetical protein